MKTNLNFKKSLKPSPDTGLEVDISNALGNPNFVGGYFLQICF